MSPRIAYRQRHCVLIGLILHLMTFCSLASANSRCEKFLDSLSSRPSWNNLLVGQNEYARWFTALEQASGPTAREIKFAGPDFHAQVFIGHSQHTLNLRLGRLGLGEVPTTNYVHLSQGLSVRFAKMLYTLIHFVEAELQKHPELKKVKIVAVDVRNHELNTLLKDLEFKSRNRFLRNAVAAGVWGGVCLGYYGLTGDMRGSSAVAFMAAITQSFNILINHDSGPTWTMEANVIRDSSGQPRLCYALD